MSMFRKCFNHTLLTIPRQREEEPHNIKSKKTAKRHKSTAPVLPSSSR